MTHNFCCVPTIFRPVQVFFSMIMYQYAIQLEATCQRVELCGVLLISSSLE